MNVSQRGLRVPVRGEGNVFDISYPPQHPPLLIRANADNLIKTGFNKNLPTELAGKSWRTRFEAADSLCRRVRPPEAAAPWLTDVGGNTQFWLLRRRRGVSLGYSSGFTSPYCRCPLVSGIAARGETSNETRGPPPGPHDQQKKINCMATSIDQCLKLRSC